MRLMQIHICHLQSVKVEDVTLLIVMFFMFVWGIRYGEFRSNCSLSLLSCLGLSLWSGGFFVSQQPSVIAMRSHKERIEI